MTDGDNKKLASVGISSSLDTILVTTLGALGPGSLKPNVKDSKKLSSLKYFNTLREKTFSENSSKSSSGASLSSINNNNVKQLPYQFYQPQLSNSWSTNPHRARSQSIYSQVRRGFACHRDTCLILCEILSLHIVAEWSWADNIVEWYRDLSENVLRGNLQPLWDLESWCKISLMTLTRQIISHGGSYS